MRGAKVIPLQLRAVRRNPVVAGGQWALMVRADVEDVSAAAGAEDPVVGAAVGEAAAGEEVPVQRGGPGDRMVLVARAVAR